MPMSHKPINKSKPQVNYTIHMTNLHMIIGLKESDCLTHNKELFKPVAFSLGKAGAFEVYVTPVYKPSHRKALDGYPITLLHTLHSEQLHDASMTSQNSLEPRTCVKIADKRLSSNKELSSIKWVFVDTSIPLIPVHAWSKSYLASVGLASVHKVEKLIREHSSGVSQPVRQPSVATIDYPASSTDVSTLDSTAVSEVSTVGVSVSITPNMSITHDRSGEQSGEQSPLVSLQLTPMSNRTTPTSAQKADREAHIMSLSSDQKLHPQCTLSIKNEFASFESLQQQLEELDVMKSNVFRSKKQFVRTPAVLNQHNITTESESESDIVIGPMSLHRSVLRNQENTSPNNDAEISGADSCITYPTTPTIVTQRLDFGSPQHIACDANDASTPNSNSVMEPVCSTVPVQPTSGCVDNNANPVKSNCIQIKRKCYRSGECYRGYAKRAKAYQKGKLTMIMKQHIADIRSDVSQVGELTMATKSLLPVVETWLVDTDRMDLDEFADIKRCIQASNPSSSKTEPETTPTCTPESTSSTTTSFKDELLLLPRKSPPKKSAKSNNPIILGVDQVRLRSVYRM